ncbi:MAG: hypothetical protein K8L99_13130 [Anaerolineae bacterium]|nr:hypothetical protein [Anaerolineae bacterium]
MIEALTPRSIVDILGRTFRLYSQHFMAYIAVAVMTVIPLVTVSILFDRSVPAGNLNDSTLVQYNLLFSFYLIASVIIQAVFVGGPTTYMASEQNLGRKVLMGEAFRAVRTKLADLGLAMAGFYALLIALGIFSAFTVLCLIGLVGFAILIYASIAVNAFLVPIIVLEDSGPMAGITRAWALAKARFWPVFWLTVAVSVISFGVSLALDFVLPSFGGSLPTIGAFVGLLIQVVISALTAPIMPIAMTLLYYDTRVRLEGLDRSMQTVQKSEPRPGDVSPSPLNPRLNSQDVRNIVFLLIGVFVVSLLAGAAFESILGPSLSGLSSF